VHNESRAKRGLLPASTFKIPNTLIALDQGAVRDEKEIIRWDGKDKGLAAWNRDQSIETAFPMSCVWFYQALAKRSATKISGSSREAGLRQQADRPGVTTFLAGGRYPDLGRGAVEFLKRLYRRTCPAARTTFRF
jgi:beta-lactamase class D